MSEAFRFRKLAIPALVFSIGLTATGCTKQTVAAHQDSSPRHANSLPAKNQYSIPTRHKVVTSLRPADTNAYIPGEKSYAGCKPSSAWSGVYRRVSDEKDVTVRQLDTYAKALNVPPSRVLGGTLVRIVCNGADDPLFVKQHAAFTQWLAGDICLLTKPIANSGASEAICPESLGR